jgi:hypothetical protein
MSAILMIEITDDTGLVWNLNLDYVTGVQMPAPGPPGPQTRITSDLIHLSNNTIIEAPPGTWHTALASLIADFNAGNRKVEEFLFVGGGP